MAIKAGIPIPAHIADAPELLPFNELPWRCFWDLRRGVSQDTPLRWVDVQQWCAAYGVPPEQTLGIQTCVLNLDVVFNTFHVSKLKDQQAAEKAAQDAKRDDKRQRVSR